MVGYSVNTKPNGVTIHKEGLKIQLTQGECNKLAKLIWRAQREYWR